MREVILIPSAKLVPAELRPEFGDIPSAMIPVGSRPIMTYITDALRAFGRHTIIATGENGHLIENHVAALGRDDLETIAVGPTQNLGETVLRALAGLPQTPDRLLINFADTFVGDELPEGDVICIRPAGEDASRWTTFTRNGTNKIDRIREKYQTPLLSDAAEAFVGVFRIADPGAFRAHLVHACATAHQIDPFYTALTAYLRDRSNPTFHDVSQWYDFGHIDTYYRARRTFGRTARYFNTVDIRPETGTLVKRARDHGKLAQEADWYNSLPPDLAHICPRVLRSTQIGDTTELELELYSYPSLNEMYLFGAFDDAVWAHVFDALDRILDHMGSHRLNRSDDDPTLREARGRMYAEKTRKRLVDAMSSDNLRGFTGETVSINGQRLPGLTRVADHLEDFCDVAGVYAPASFTIVHGDLCLSNLLFDRRNGFIRVVDPRGDFGGFKLYGDPYYDAAKLAHSFEGDYDFIVNDLVKAEWHRGDFIFRTAVDARHARVKDLFYAWLTRRYGPAEIHRVRAIEALLFLSMVPLHADNPLAQQCFVARGLQLYDQIYGTTRIAA